MSSKQKEKLECFFIRATIAIVVVALYVLAVVAGTEAAKWTLELFGGWRS